MRVGIAIPCHVQDKPYLQECLGTIANLNPEPHRVLINMNNGNQSLQTIRTQLYDELFTDCQVVLQCCADYHLFPDILKHIHPSKVTSFNRLNRGLTDIPRLILHILQDLRRGRSWTGCYSIPKHLWKTVRNHPVWDGTDHSLHQILGANYVFVLQPKLWLQRRSENRLQDFLDEPWSWRKLFSLFFRGVI